MEAKCYADLTLQHFVERSASSAGRLGTRVLAPRLGNFMGRRFGLLRKTRPRVAPAMSRVWRFSQTILGGAAIRPRATEAPCSHLRLQVARGCSFGPQKSFGD